MSLPRQAAILCGGLGVRLRPLTNDRPKPMAVVNGRPFLEYLVQQLREQGVERVVLMTGYLGQVIRDHFGDGSAFGVEIAYSDGPAEWETGRRLWEARSLLDATFLLLYSDNYVPFTLETLYTHHCKTGAVVTALVQTKTPGNVRLREDGLVDLYDSSRRTPGLNLVEIGYMVAERDGLFAAMDPANVDVSLSRTLTRLSSSGLLGGMVTADPYHSISELDRLRLTERYLAPKRIMLIDRDGTINRRPPRAEYVRTWDQFQWEPSTVEAMRQLAQAGFRFAILSNQAGIARGMLTAGDLDAIHTQMTRELADQGIEILGIYICPHHWDDGCQCRKPAPGMFHQVSVEHQLRLNRTVFVGDDPRDSLAAHNASSIGVLIGEDYQSADAAQSRPAQAARHMTELVPWISATFEAWEKVA